MKPVAGCQLRRLHSQEHGEALQLPFEFRAARQHPEQGTYFHTIGGSVGLGHHSQRAGLEPEDYRQPNEPFISG